VDGPLLVSLSLGGVGTLVELVAYGVDGCSSPLADCVVGILDLGFVGLVAGKKESKYEGEEKGEGEEREEKRRER
jgi:hypothetical protein